MNLLNIVKSNVSKDYNKQFNNDFLIGKDETLEPKFTKIFGINYKVNIYYLKIFQPELFLNNDTINIHLPMNLRKNNNQELLNVILYKMYYKIAEKELENIFEKARHVFGFAPEDYIIKNIHQSLAECDKENQIITINPFITKYSKDVIEYIVFHEFCHLHYKNHTKNFYNMLKKYIPHYETLANQLSNFKY